MNEQSVRASRQARVAEFLQTTCEVPATRGINLASSRLHSRSAYEAGSRDDDKESTEDG